MFNQITPERAGISSKTVSAFVDTLKKCGARTHAFIFMRNGEIFGEGYYKPFDVSFCHRAYSETKSFVGVAVGLLLEEGKLSLDDRIADYFPDKIDGDLPPFLSEQTVEEMLTMTTIGESGWWFASPDPDRIHQYFNIPRRTVRPSGTVWEYDSQGSQVLCALVERLAEKPLLQYLREKIFDKIGAFETARTLKTPGGVTWGDSAMICTLRDMAVFGQFVMNYGVWNGQRLMNAEYLKRATSRLVDNTTDGKFSGRRYGYGYQIWKVSHDGFAFIGMGDQLTICYPDKGLLFSCFSDNQGHTHARERIISEINDIYEEMAETSVPENEQAYRELTDKLSRLELYCENGKADSPLIDRINGQKYTCNDNPMGITEFTFDFTDGETGSLRYRNAQGDKTLVFGINKNHFGYFPQYGYSKEVGGEKTTDGSMYKDAVSLAFADDNKILMTVQIIDDYFGNLGIVFAFKDNMAVARFTPSAENFLTEYKGSLLAYRADSQRE